MAEELKVLQIAEEAISAVRLSQQAGTSGKRKGVDRTTPRFNRYLYENLFSNVEVQIESWNRQAGRESNPQAAQTLRLKAEGLGYALRLLDSFQPEFRELIDCANHCIANGST